MDKRVKIILLSVIGVGLVIGGYFAYKNFFKASQVNKTAKKERKVFINNTK